MTRSHQPVGRAMFEKVKFGTKLRCFPVIFQALVHSIDLSTTLKLLRLQGGGFQ